MSFCCQPCSFSFQARLRRSSRQSAFLGAPILLSYHTLLACAEISKTLITHAREERARFLGYEVHTLQDNSQHRKGRRSINARIGFRVPDDVVREKCRGYQRGNAPTHRPELTTDSDFSIMAHYQAEYRGVVEYYRLAYNLSVALRKVKRVMEQSLVMTLASKLKMSVPRVYQRYQATIITNGEAFRCTGTPKQSSMTPLPQPREGDQNSKKACCLPPLRYVPLPATSRCIIFGSSK